MKKTIYLLFALLFVLTSCVQELNPIELRSKAEETGLVAVTMELTIPNVEIQALTKANDRSHNPQIDYIRVAVFGTSGFPQAYNLAEPVGTYATQNDVKYTFKVLLPIYEGEAHVHIIANGDETIPYVDENSEEMSEESIMSAMYTENNVGAFWTSVILPDGILPVMNEYGIYQTDGTTGNFVPSEETANAFKNLVLVRNFAEVKLIIGEDVDNLSDISWTVVNVPTKGSVVPMWSEGAFVYDYQDYVYDVASGRMKSEDGTKTYEGYTFDDDEMDITVPADGVLPLSEGQSGFLYERVLPTEHASCILMRGKFHHDSYYTYYRLDLTNESLGGYFPIYRNYMYQLRVRKVNNRGTRTPAEAMLRDSGGNISQSLEAKKLTDISDGTSRLYVEYVEKNFTSGGKKGLWVYYKPDVVNHPDVVDNSSIALTVKTQGDALVEGTEITLTAESSDTGVYFYEFELNDQDEEDDLVSVLMISANNGLTGDDRSTLYRDITLRVMHKMDMTLSLVPKQVSGVGTHTVLNIGLPDGLPSSMFPLELHIEDVNHTLNPTQTDGNGNALIIPVKTDKSLVDGTTNSFYFIRTVNETEYLANHTISTEFETIKSASATTVYVANEYFKTQSTNLLNNGMYVNPTNASVPFSTTSVIVEVEFAEPAGKAWTVSGTSPVTITDEEGTAITGGTGNGTFKMNFPANNSTTGTVTRTATVTYNGTSQTVTIIQDPLHFSVTPATQTIIASQTTATVTIHAESGKAWTASISGPNGTNPTLSATSGEGTATLTVNLPANTTTSQRSFTVTATMTDPALTETATITQRRVANTYTDFAYNAFGNFSGSASGTSADSYVTVNLDNCYKGTYNGYIRTSYDGQYGKITITPVSGMKITTVVITYDNDYVDTNPTVSTGTRTVSGNTVTWTVNSANAVTYTSSNNGGTYQGRRMTNIRVNYEPL